MTLDCKNIKLKKGSNGNEVKEVQTILKQSGFYQGVIDGDYGDMTVDAVNKFQRSCQITVDGWVGSQTCNKLKSITTSVSEIVDIKTVNGKKFYKDTITEAAKTFRTHIKNNKNYPNYLPFTDSSGKKYNIGRSAYMGIFEDVSIFAVKNYRMPNYVVASSTANNPLVIDYQNNGYNCGPTSLSMCFQMLGYWVSEPTLASQCGTNSNGTGPSDLIRVAKNHGFSMEVINRNGNAVKEAINSGYPVLMHVHTSYAGGKSCLGYYGSYGHYIVCYGMVGNYYLIADPTKGFKKCLSTSIDSARSSTNMKFYQIKPI